MQNNISGEPIVRIKVEPLDEDVDVENNVEDGETWIKSEILDEYGCNVSESSMVGELSSNCDSDYCPPSMSIDIEENHIDLSIVKQEPLDNVNSNDSDVHTTELLDLSIETSGNYSKCPKCFKNIKATFILRHIKLHDTPLETIACPEVGCPLQVTRPNNMFRHLKKVHKSKIPYMCRHASCHTRFSTSKALQTHLRSHRTDDKLSSDGIKKEQEKTFSCEYPGCGKTYGKRHHLKEHERRHTGDTRFSCEVCGRGFYIQAHMKRHLYSHTGVKPHVCRWKCGSIFASYGGRMKHERITHYDTNPLKSECNICGRPFNNHKQLDKHIVTHLSAEERQPYRCSYCNILFDTIKRRKSHEERHRDGEQFVCETCDKKFKNEKNLGYHVRVHHCPSIPVKPRSQAPRHKCPQCPLPKWYGLSTLRRHLARVHSTNYRCSRAKCGKSFQMRDRFEAHEESHRLRECHLCLRTFKRKQNADIHLVGVHGLTVADLKALGRWRPVEKGGISVDEFPEYITRRPWTNCKKKNARTKKDRLNFVNISVEEAPTNNNINSSIKSIENEATKVIICP